MTFLELAEKILLEEKKPLSVPEIWKIAQEKSYDSFLKSVGKTPEATLGAQLYVTAKDNKKSVFGKIENTRPKKFYLKKFFNPLIDNVEHFTDKELIVKEDYPFKEKDLHPFLVYYAYLHLRAYSKTINHSKSNKKEFGEWVHPDIVSCYYPIDDWKPEVVDLSSGIGSLPIRLISFELKRELSLGNLRESFFQTVSNSSWANESYLVAAKVSREEDFFSELKRLSSAFGIGIIEININDPDSTELVIPAKSREGLEWESINKLSMNDDFREFLTRVRIDISSKKIHKKEYDQIFTAEQLRNKIIK